MDLAIVGKLLEPYLEEHQLKLYDVELVKEFGYTILRVSIDKTGGIDVDTLALVNEYLSSKIEPYDADLPEYMLEVCSPGAEKPLRNKEEILESIGSYIHAEIEGMIYEGTLEAFVDDVLTILINAKGRFKKVLVPYGEIKSIRLAVKM